MNIMAFSLPKHVANLKPHFSVVCLSSFIKNTTIWCNVLETSYVSVIREMPHNAFKGRCKWNRIPKLPVKIWMVDDPKTGWF